MTSAFQRLVDDQTWEALRALLPPAPAAGRPRRNDRSCLEGVLLVQLAGIGWGELPASLGLGSGVTCWRRHREWVQAGVWDTTRRVALDAVGADAARDWAVRALRKGRRTSAPTSALPRRRGPAARRRQLLDAAVALLAEGGAAAVTVEAVVSRLGVSRPVFYSHFPHRSALLAAIYDEYATVVLNAMNAVSVDGLPLEEQVRRTTVAYFDAVGGFGVVVRALVATAPGDEVVEAARRRLRRAAEDRALHQVRRRPRVDEGALRLALRLVNAMAEQAATEWLEGRATRRLVERVHVNAAVAVLTPLVRQT